MENSRSIEFVDRATFGSVFRKPLYGSYCFAHLPDTICKTLGAPPVRGPTLPSDVLPHEKGYETVIVVLVDAFGWRFLERYTRDKPIPGLVSLRDRAITSKITSQFPSTTAAHVTTMHSGLPVGETGVYEWYYYEHRVDTVVSPLMFCKPGEGRLNTLLDRGVEPQSFLPASTLYQHLGAHGVASHVFQLESYSSGAYSKHMLRGAEIHPFTDYRAALTEVRELVTASSARQYIFFYFDRFDSTMHHHGVNHPHADQVAEEFFTALETKLIAPLREGTRTKKGDTLLLVTADHGMVEMDYRRTVLLDRVAPELLADTTRTGAGDPIIPCGSSRDLFLHYEQGGIDEKIRALQDILGEKGEVYPTQYLLDRGFFGSASPELCANLGQICILPYQGESVYIAGPNDRFLAHFIGHHGGLTPEEMDSILLAVDL